MVYPGVSALKSYEASHRLLLDNKYDSRIVIILETQILIDNRLQGWVYLCQTRRHTVQIDSIPARYLPQEKVDDKSSSMLHHRLLRIYSIRRNLEFGYGMRNAKCATIFSRLPLSFNAFTRL